jgi:branched-chain amino acid transport system substrate-binding protein
MVNRRQLLSAFGAVSIGAVVGGCGNSVGDDGDDGAAQGGGAVKVGLVIPQSGVYAPLGKDMKQAWEPLAGEERRQVR